jgi:hypothetical protein
MKFFSKIFFFLLINLILFNQTSLYARSYDNNIIEILSKIIPRIVLMSSLKNNINTNINICILRDDFDKDSALYLIKKIKENYPNGISKYNFSFIENNFSKVELCKNSHLTFIFDSQDSQIKDSLSILNKYQILTMSYNNHYLEYGVGSSLFIGKKVVPYLNTEAIFNNKLEIDNILLRISKIYKKKSL